MNKRLLCVITIAILCIGLLIANDKISYATSTDYDLDQLCQNYTSSDTPNGVSIREYAKEVAEFYSKPTSYAYKKDDTRFYLPGKLFQQGCFYHGTNNEYVSVSISADDTITKIVPRQLFTEEGEKFYLGKEYGFYVNTRTVKKQNITTVVLLDVFTDRPTENDYMASLRVEILLKVEYYYLDTQTTEMMFRDDYNDMSDHKTSSIVFREGLTSAVVPAIRSYTSIPIGARELYYYFEYIEPNLDISDISFGANIYNANSLNCGDSGYSIENDYGYFFIGNEYEFSASKKKATGDFVQGTVKFAKAAASFALGRLIKNDVLAQQIISCISGAFTVTDIVKTYVGDELVYNETNKNYVYPNTHLHNTRDSQKQAYGGLAKTSAIMINTTEDDRLYFCSGDYAKGTFSFSHTDKPTGKEYSQLSACVGMKIRDKGTWSACVSNNITFDISPQETHTLNVMQEHGYYMLPNGTMKFAANPEFGGEYVFDVANNDVELLLDGVVQPKNNGKYTVNLQGNKQQIITLRNNGTKIAIGKVTFDCAEIFGNHTIGAGQSNVYKLSGSNRHYILATQNPNVQFTKLFDKNMSATNVFSNATECQAFTYGKDCYVSVKNTSSAPQTINVVARETETMSTSGKTLTAEAGQKYLKFSFKASTAGNYTFKFDYDEDGETFGARVYNATFDRRTYTVRTSDTFETYKVALSANETVNIVIERYTNLDRAWSSNCTVETSPREMWVVEGRTTKLNENLVHRGQHLCLSLKTPYGDIIPVTKDVISDRKYDLSITEGQLTVDIFAQVGVIPLHFVVDTIEYNENGNPISGHEEYVFLVHIAINTSVNTETLTHDNNENGVTVSMIDDTYLTQVEITVVNGNNNATTTLKKGTTVDILKLMTYNNTIYTTTVKTNRALYKYKDSAGKINTEWVQNGYYYFYIADIETSHLFGDESTDSDIKIFNRRHLQNLGKGSSGGKTYNLQNDIDLSGKDWQPIDLFEGYFNGQNHSIKNMTINIPQSSDVLDRYGLFSTMSGRVTDLKLEKVEILGEKHHEKPYMYIGGLTGYNNGTIDNVTISGTLNVNRSYSGMGGITGRNYGRIFGCIAKNVYIFGNGNMGGIIGVGVEGTVKACHTESLTLNLYVKTENRCVGGIAGYIEGTVLVEHCYNTNATIKFVGYNNIAKNKIAPRMGIIVGTMNGGTVRNVSVKSTTLDYGDLPEKDRIGLGAWHYPRKYIGAYGNGAVGYAHDGYTIDNTNWSL